MHTILVSLKKKLIVKLAKTLSTLHLDSVFIFLAND